MESGRGNLNESIEILRFAQNNNAKQLAKN